MVQELCFQAGSGVEQHWGTSLPSMVAPAPPHVPLFPCSIRWCGPCKILGPRLEKLVSKLEGKVLMAKVDIDDHTDLAIEYEVGGGRAQTFCGWQCKGGRAVPAQQQSWRGGEAQSLQVPGPLSHLSVGGFCCWALLAVLSIPTSNSAGTCPPGLAGVCQCKTPLASRSLEHSWRFAASRGCSGAGHEHDVTSPTLLLIVVLCATSLSSLSLPCSGSLAGSKHPILKLQHKVTL